MSKKAKVDKGECRAVTLPVAVPLGTDPDGRPWTWETFDARMGVAFRLSTDLANWCSRRLFKLDDESSAKTPPQILKWYGYKDAAENYHDNARWAGAMASLGIVTRTVHRKYIRQRFNAVVRHVSRLLTYRHPFPFPVHNAVWKTSYADGGFPVVNVNIPGVGAVELRLKRRADFGRQLAGFKALHDGTATRGEAALYRDGKGVLLVKLVGYFPRRVPAESPTNVCFLHTDPNALLVAEVNGRSVNVTNAGHLRRARAVVRSHNERHKLFLEHAREDKKREVRMDPRQRENLNKKVEERCRKQRDKIKTATQQVAAQVVKFCARQRVYLICYDDSNKAYIPDGFDWSGLKERIRQSFVGTMGGEWLDGQFAHLNDEGEKDEWLRKAKSLLSTARNVSASKSRPPGKSHPAVSRPRATSPASAGRSSTTSSTGRRPEKSPTPSAGSET